MLSHVSPPQSHRSLTRLQASVIQFHYLPLSIFPFKALCTQRFSEIHLTMKFKTDGPELPATDASNRCLSYVPTIVGYIMVNFKWAELHEKHSVATGNLGLISAFA